ncbi:MAG: CBS domain-containing protein [Rhodothermales bacterium]
MTTIAANLTANDIMTTEVVPAKADWPLDRLAEFLIENDFSGAPVVDDDGALVGVVSLVDLVRHDSLPETVPWTRTLADYFRHDEYKFNLENQYADEELAMLRVDGDTTVTVADIMNRDIYSVDPETPIQVVADMMAGGQIHRVLVTCAGEVVGVVTTLDLLQILRES